MGWLDDIKQKTSAVASSAVKKAGEAWDSTSAACEKIAMTAEDVWNASGKTAQDVAEWAKSAPDTIGRYAKDFDAAKMWDKISAYAAKAGQELILIVLTMYYAIADSFKKSEKEDERNSG